MTFNETTLHELLASPYGQQCGHAFLERVQDGKTLTIHMQDGSEVFIEDVETAVQVLKERFGWVLED